MNEPLTKEAAVRNLQRYLRRLSYEHGEILPVPVDGIFDTRTEEALLAFQRLYGLSPTGRANRESWELLFAEYGRLTTEQDEIVRVDLFPKAPAGYATQLGEESAFVVLIQWLLLELSVLYDTLPPLSPSGIYDEQTAAAVAEFQEISGLAPTGALDRATWNRLVREYELFAS